MYSFVMNESLETHHSISVQQILRANLQRIAESPIRNRDSRSREKERLRGEERAARKEEREERLSLRCQKNSKAFVHPPIAEEHTAGQRTWRLGALRLNMGDIVAKAFMGA